MFATSMRRTMLKETCADESQLFQNVVCSFKCQLLLSLRSYFLSYVTCLSHSVQSSLGQESFLSLCCVFILF